MGKINYPSTGSGMQYCLLIPPPRVGGTYLAALLLLAVSKCLFAFLPQEQRLLMSIATGVFIWLYKLDWLHTYEKSEVNRHALPSRSN